MIYILGWIANYLLMLFPWRTLKAKRHACIAAILFVGLIAFLRGRVGADTGYVYETMAANLDEAIAIGTEPLFVGLLSVLMLIFHIPLLAVTMGLSAVSVALLVLYVCKATESEIFVLQGFFIPAIVYKETISGMRFGIAFFLLLLATQCFRLRSYKWFAALSVLAIFTHYSSIVFLLIWLFMILDYQSRRTVLVAIAVFVSCLAAVIFGLNHFEIKYVLYSDFFAPSALSGLVTVAKILIVTAGMLFAPFQTEDKVRIAVPAVVITAIFYIITQYTYGGLRLMDIMELIVPWAVLMIYNRRGFRLGPKFKIAVLTAGLLGAIFFYKDLIVERNSGEGVSPGLPYKFIWEERDLRL